MTKGVYQYKDLNDVTRVQTTFKEKQLSRGVEYEHDSETDELFDELFDKDSLGFVLLY